MDTIGRIRTAIFRTTEKKEKPPEKFAKSPLNSLYKKSSAHRWTDQLSANTFLRTN